MDVFVLCLCHIVSKLLSAYITSNSYIMERLFFMLFFMLCGSVYCQGHKYALHSDIWKLDGGKMVPISYIPGAGDMDSVDRNMDMAEVRSYLLEAFNEFRKDYGSPLVAEDATLSLRCQSYSKRLVFDFEHDPKASTECIGFFSMNSLCPIVGSGEDFNRAVAEYIFDLFVLSGPHMGILLNRFYLHYGFGAVLDGGGVYVVIRCY